jgi:hypothetical protein
MASVNRPDPNKVKRIVEGQPKGSAHNVGRDAKKSEASNQSNQPEVSDKQLRNLRKF